MNSFTKETVSHSRHITGCLSIRAKALSDPSIAGEWLTSPRGKHNSGGPCLPDSSLGLIGDVSGQTPEYEVEEPDPRHLR